jgi:hypothetical protein
MATFFATNDADFDVALADALANPGEDTIIAFAGAYVQPHIINSDVTLQGAKVGQAGNAPGGAGSRKRTSAAASKSPPPA